MPSPETTPERDLSRAHWQRSEANVVYTEIFEQVLDRLSAKITDRMIVDHMAEVDLDPLRAINHLVHLPYMLFSAADLPKFATSVGFEKTVGRRINEYTYEGSVLKTMDEGLKTMLAFPASLLSVINHEHQEQSGQPLVRSLRSGYQTYASSDFSEMVHSAAFAPNGFWPSKFSDLPVSVDATYLRDFSKGWPGFIADPKNRFGFRLDSAKQLAHITANNRRGDSTVPPSDPDLTKLATSGCPIRLARAQFSPKDVDQERLLNLASLLHRPTEEIKISRQQSGIQSGLEFTTELLRRATILDKHRRIGRQAMPKPARLTFSR